MSIRNISIMKFLVIIIALTILVIPVFSQMESSGKAQGTDKSNDVAEQVNKIFIKLETIEKDKDAMMKEVWDSKGVIEKAKLIWLVNNPQATIDICKIESEDEANAYMENTKLKMSDEEWLSLTEQSMYILQEPEFGSYYESRDKLIDELSALGKAAIPLLVAKIDDPTISENLKYSAQVAISKMKPSVGNTVIEMLNKSIDAQKNDSTLALLAALINVGNSSANQVLIKALKEDDIRIKQAAAQALVKFGNSNAQDTLIEALEVDDDFVKLYSIRALRVYGDSAAIPPIEKIVNELKAYLKDKGEGDDLKTKLLEEAQSTLYTIKKKSVPTETEVEKEEVETTEEE